VPCLASLGHLTADKRFAIAHPNFLTEASFIRNTLGKIAGYMWQNLEVNDHLILALKMKKDRC
jgi:hypothetical protein